MNQVGCVCVLFDSAGARHVYGHDTFYHNRKGKHQTRVLHEGEKEETSAHLSTERTEKKREK